MKPLTPEELQQILDTTGLTKNAVEKKFGMGQGSVGKFLTGKLNSLPDKYVGKIRKLGYEADKGVELKYTEFKDEIDVHVNWKEVTDKKKDDIIHPIKEIDMPYVSPIEYINNIQPVEPVNFNNDQVYKEDEANFQKFRDNLDRNIEISKRNKVYSHPLIDKTLLP